MKDETVWDYSICNIGHPCSKCIDSCSFKKITCSRDNDQDEKEKENERIFEGNEE